MTPHQFGEWRAWLGLTQAQVAKELDISKRTVSVYETKGPIPRPIALACMAITDQVEFPDYAKLVEAQHPRIVSPYVVMPYEVKRSSRYRSVYCFQETGEPQFSSELQQWLEESEYNIRSGVVTIELPDNRRRDVAIVIFDDAVVKDSFMWRWR